MIEKVNLSQKFDLISDFWAPGIVAELNGQHVKLGKIKGEFDWHFHEHEDELFMVIKGSFDLEFRDRVVTLNEGELCVVPKGVEHRPVAREEAHILLFEPASTLNTGNVTTEKTRLELKHL